VQICSITFPVLIVLQLHRYKNASKLGHYVYHRWIAASELSAIEFINLMHDIHFTKPEFYDLQVDREYFLFPVFLVFSFEQYPPHS